ncbi:MAG: glycosyl transferase, partial [Actinomycetia bacterium]|nr:glycosyl transferase [Actinomycetes bacterium]
LPTAGPAGSALGRGGPGGARRFAGGAPPAGLGANPGAFTPGAGGNFAGAPAFRGGFPGGGANGGGRGFGGLLNSSKPSAAITALFEQSAGFRWTAAAIGADNAAGYQLASGQAIMAIGGFNGTDPTPTLAQFEQYVRTGQIHYFIASGGGGPGGGSASTSSAITQWVEQHFTARTVGGTTIYDLSATPSP